MPYRLFIAAGCQFGLMLVPDKDRAFREMRRVLVKGDLLALSVWDRMETNPCGSIVHETVAEFLQDNPPQFFRAPHSFADVDVLRKLLNTSGFGQIEIQAVSKECSSNTARSLAIGMIEGAPILAEVQERGGSPGPIIDTVAAAFAQLGGDSPFRSTMQAIVVTARAGGGQ